MSDKNSKSYYWMPTFYVKHPKFNRDDLINTMAKKNIALRPCFYPLHKFNFYKSKFNSSNYKNSILISRNGINLPSYYELDNTSLDYVIKEISNYFRKKKIK